VHRTPLRHGLLTALVLVTLGLLLPVSSEGSGRFSSEFSLTLKELGAMTSTLPPALREGIMGRPIEFLHLVAAVLDQDPVFFLLVDKTHPLGIEYSPTELVRLSRDFKLPVSGADVQLSAAVMGEIIAMAKGARADGVTLVFSSGYRSFAYQRIVYDREVKLYGQEMADRESARPGMSQHQLGTAIDFGSITDAFAETQAGKWLAAHAGEYGFSLSYPQNYEWLTGYRYESWHFRYITRAGTALQKQFFGDIQQYLLLFLHDHRSVLEARRTSRQ
jgi:zinc D-Ala-D-Ala carboxypeptidase